MSLQVPKTSWPRSLQGALKESMSSQQPDCSGEDADAQNAACKEHDGHDILHGVKTVPQVETHAQV